MPDRNILPAMPPLKGSECFISVVIPVYNAENCIDELHERLVATLSEIRPEFEILYVDDYSKDGSWAKILDVTGNDERFKGIKLCRNFGQHYALTAGLEFVDSQYTIIMDCDLQDRPEDIPLLLKSALEGNDVVLARRNRNVETDGFLDRVTSKVFYRTFDYFTDTKSDPAVGAYRVMSRKVVQTFQSMPERHRFFGGMIQWMGFKTSYVDVQRSERFAGNSSYHLLKRLRLAIDAIFSFSNKPLQFMAGLGGVIMVICLFAALRIVYMRIAGDMQETGYASLIVSVYFLSGIILTSLGVLGSYIGRIFDQVKGRPLFLIEETTFDER